MKQSHIDDGPVLSMDTTPQGFAYLGDVDSAPNAKVVNLMGVVYDFQPAAPSNGPDWQMSIQLKDATCSDSMSLRVKIFSKQENLPQDLSVGDVLIVRNVKVSSYGGVKGCLSTWETSTIVFPSGQIPAPEFKLEYANGAKRITYRSKGRNPQTPTIQEQFYAMGLRRWSLTDFLQDTTHSMRTDPPVSRSRTRGEPLRNPSSQRAEKYRLIKDIEASQFHDLVVEVVKIYPNPYNTLEVYVTDYTSNNLLCDYPWPTPTGAENQDAGENEYYDSQYGQRRKAWDGPYGKQTFQIQVWEPHCHWLRDNVNEGDTAVFRNVHTKYLFNSSNPVLAGALHQDRLRPSQVDIHKPSDGDPRVKQLLDRKADYVGELRKRLEQPSKRKNKKKRGEASHYKKEQGSSANKHRDGPVEHRFEATPTPLSSGVNASQSPPKSSIPGNAHVSFNHMDVPVTSVEDLCNVDRSFVSNGVTHHWNYTNQKIHARLRVLDYLPNNLEEFSRRFEDTDGKGEDSTHPGDWIWCFYLRVEDASVPAGTSRPINLFVGGEDATHLLKMKACDLTGNPKKLAELREKLFILWGNAEELKNEGMTLPHPDHSSKPFDCGIQEYGVLLDGETDWSKAHRNFGIFGTTIQT